MTTLILARSAAHLTRHGYSPTRDKWVSPHSPQRARGIASDHLIALPGWDDGLTTEQVARVVDEIAPAFHTATEEPTALTQIRDRLHPTPA